MGGRAPCGGAKAARKGTVTPLADALRQLELNGDLSHGGRWLTLSGDRFRVFVVESPRGGYFTWCDDSDEQAVIFFRDARAAIEGGLGRAAERRRWEQEV